MAANMSAGKLGPPDSSDAPPTPLEARSVHTTRIIESHLTWVAKQNRHRQNSRFLMESPPPDIGVGAAEPHLPDFFSRQGFFCPRARSFPALESPAFAVFSEHVSSPNKKNATPQFPAQHPVRSLQRCFAHHSRSVGTWPLFSARHRYGGYSSYPNLPPG
ncbi:uncharacterized protein K444DRAFT_195421 [Hyaloscypha bicolor E]|uniref:Uncharacterized protein n=1 Tax=Hyaloscypha bicolor E TaxID=1095630 RepID=A0A2J6SQF7_9HELO|nr:uncharacterized protein K444DRAFT_195421 [Hyaloscypha bicolor E]PMD52980.1 hypothetical protein K444DRAFT_195421 [Hyaloscypha bicolor E]